MTREKEPRSREDSPQRASWIQRIRVPLGFLFGLVFLYFAQPRHEFFWPSLVVAAFGAGVRVWAAGILKKQEELARSGPYAYTRNPLYFGSSLLGLGLCLAAGQPLLLILFLALFSLIYYPVMKREENELKRAFGPSYREYAERVPLFFPGTRAGERAGERNFSWSRVIRNREYRAVIGFIAICMFLFARRYSWF